MKKMSKTIIMKYLVMLVMAVLIAACGRTTQESASEFVTVEDGHFVKNGKPYYYVMVPSSPRKGRAATVSGWPGNST